MSTYSAAWSAASNETRAAYNSFALRYTYYLNPFWVDGASPPAESYTTLGWSFLGYRGFDVFCHNLTSQTALYGTFAPDRILLTAHALFSDPSPDMAFDIAGFTSWGDQLTDPEALAYNFPRARYRPRRCYTSGLATRRRNLP